jgi:TonB family protein
VSLSVRWGDHQLAREFLPLSVARSFTVGSEAACDFSCPGARSFRLLEIDAESVALRPPKNSVIELTRHNGERSSSSAKAVFIERGDSAQLGFGPLTFEVRVLEAPPAVSGAGVTDFTTVNLALMLIAGFGLFSVAAANRDAEGAELDDELRGNPARAIRVLQSVKPPPSSSGSAPAAVPQKSKPASGPSRPALPSRSTGRPSQQLALDVRSIFAGPGATHVFSPSSLGQELTAAASGLRSARAGDGFEPLEGGHGLDGRGPGGLNPEGIGNVPTHGRGLYGNGPNLRPGPKPSPVGWEDPVIDSCATDGAGCLDKEIVRRVIRQNLAGFRFCYESMLNRFPTLEGKVVVRFSISHSGRVTSSEVAQSTAANRELERCVSSRTQLLQFPAQKWNGNVVVTYPFVFKQSGR